MKKDKYGHYVNDKGVEIKASTDKSGKSHVDIYDKCPAVHEDHSSIHIDYNSKTGKGTIVDTTNGTKTTTNTSCYLTSACLRHLKERFDDNCEELRILRWFRDNFVSLEEKNHYYQTAPLIIETIDSIEKNQLIYEYIYTNVVLACVNAIKEGNYEFAYHRYKKMVLMLEEELVRPSLEKRLIKVLHQTTI